MAESFQVLLERRRKEALFSTGGEAPSFEGLLRERATDAGADLGNLFLDEATKGAVLGAHEQLLKLGGEPPLDEASQRMGLRPGVPMDVNEGADLDTRTSLGLDVNKLNQFKVLARKYGIESVDVSEDGRFVLRDQTDPVSGIKQDVLVDPPGLDRGDVNEFGAQALPMTAGALAARVGLKAPGLGKLGQTLVGIGAAAGTQRMLEGEQQAVVRLFRGNEANLPEIVQERAKDAAMDATLGTAMAGLGAGLRVLSPFSNLDPHIQKATAARNRLNAELVNQLPTTPGLKTGSPFLLRSEAFAARIPGSAGVFDKVRDQERAAVDELRRVSLGAPRKLTDEQLAASLPEAEAVGQASLERLHGVGQQAESAVESAAQTLARTGTVESQLLARTAVGAPVETTLVGKDLISKVRSDWDTFHAYWGDRYNDFFDKPETVALDVPASKLASMARQLKSQFTPLAKRLKETPTGLVNEAGDPITTQREVIDQLDSFVQGKVVTALDELAQLKGAKTSIRSLKQIRTNIDDAIAQNLAIPGTDTGQLKRIRSTLTDTIENALADKDPALLAEWKALNKGWSENMARFDFNNIRDILIKPGQPGAPGETQVAERVLGNSASAKDAWTAYKQFFGESSPQMLSVKQAVRSKVIEGSLDGARGYIDGAALRRNLENLRPEIASEVFGLNQQKLMEVADALATGQGKFDAGEVLHLANSRTLSAGALKSLQTAEEQRARTYSNALIKAAGKGALGPEAIQPSEFVRYMTNGKLKLDANHIRYVKSIIDQDPALSQQVSQLAVEDFFEQAGLTTLDPRKSVRISQRIDETFGDPAQQRRWEALLGQNTIRNLKDLADALRPGGLSAESFSSAGGISGGSVIAGIAGGRVEGLPEIGKRMLLAKLYTFPLTRNFLANNLMDAATTKRAINAIVTSEPFATEVLRRLGPDASRDVMGGLRKLVEGIYAGQKESEIKQ